MRSGNPSSKRGSALLEEPQPGYAPRSSALRTAPPRDYGDDFSRDYDRTASSRKPALKLKLRTRLPTSLAGRIATATALLLILAGGVGLLMVARTFLLQDPRFTLRAAGGIEVEGNRHLTHAEVLDLFADDLGHNIFRLSLVERQAQLEARPWVEHATLMRLLPGRIRVAIVERTPVAFARQGSRIALVDAEGVLLDPRPADAHLSFPVLSGISPQEPASTRAARMKIFAHFMADLDSGGQKVSDTLSEVDLSDPEDVRALLPAEASEVLVHFGSDHFLERYHAFEQHLPEWHRLYPKLASVDLRYKNEYVLDPVGVASARAEAGPMTAVPVAKPVGIKTLPSASRPFAGPVAHPPAAPPVHASKTPLTLKTPAHPSPTAPKPTPPSAPAAHPATASAASASAAARSAYLAKPSAGKPLPPPAAHPASTDPYHPPQVPVR